MDKKTVIITLILVAAYITAYFLSYLRQQEPIQSARPIVTLPICQNESTPIGILKENETVCLLDNELIIFKDNKKTPLLTFDKESKPAYIAMNGNFLVIEQNHRINISYVGPDKKLYEVANLQLSQKETIISQYSFTKEQKTHLFLSVYREVAAPEQNKTVIHYFYIESSGDNVHTFTTNKGEFLHMEKVAAVADDGKQLTVITESMFPFLQERIGIYKWPKSTPRKTPNCTDFTLHKNYIGYLLIEMKACENKSDEGLLRIDLHSGNSHKLEVNPNMNCIIEQPQISLCFDDFNNIIDKQNHIITALPLKRDHYTAITHQYSTIINKNVYNCNDFGESPQITLRVCIPIL